MKKLISLLVSLGILAVIYWKLNQNGQLGELGRIFANSDRLWMPLSLGMVVPLTLFTSWRLQQLMPRQGQLSFGEANRLILVASVLNLVLPSKMGDIAKAYFMRDRGGMSGSLALSLVVFRLRAGDAETLAAMEAVNASGVAYLSHTTVEGRAAIRLAVGSWRTTQADVDRTWRALQEAAAQG